MGSGKMAVLECPEDRFTGVLDYRSYSLRNRHSTYGASQARKMGRTAKNMKFSFGGTPMFNGKEPLKVFSWLREFVKVCDDNDVSDGMGLSLIPNFLAGDAEARFTRNLPESDIAGGQGSLGSFPAAVNWLLSTYAEPHVWGLAQDKFGRAALVDNEGVDAFAACLRSLAELCGNIHSEGTMKQQLIQGLPEYLRTDAFVYHTAQRSYQQLSTYVARKFRAAKDVMALANQRSSGGSSREGQTSTGTGGVSVKHLNSPWEEDDTATHDTVAVLPSGTPGFRTAGAAPYPRREAPTGPSLCYMCWTRGHRVPDCKILTHKHRESRAEHLPPAEERGGGRRPEPHLRRGPAVGRPVGRRGVNGDGRGGLPARGNPVQGAPRGGKRLGGVASPSPSIPPVHPNSPVAPRHVTSALPGVTATWPVPAC